CFFASATPSTMTRPSLGSTRTTRPSLPRSLPCSTFTMSSFLMSTPGIYSTSGASEMIFMNFFSRSSRATGPKMRVPRGFFCSLMITTALSSKRIYEPSGRRRSFAVRTTTARTTSPFFTAPPGRASFTVPTMTSPTPAYRRAEPPSTRMHRTSLAPVLSATLQRVSCWITGLYLKSLGLLGPFDDLDHAPALGLRHRPGLHHADGVAHVGIVGLVVRGELRRAPHDLAVQRVSHLPVDADQDGLVHLVGHDHTRPGLPGAPLERR